MRPAYDPVALAVPEEELELDDDAVYWRGSQRFDGLFGETLPNGNFEYMSFKNGWRDGPTGEVTPDGDLVVEEWFRENFLYGITRRFRQDGTLATATGYEFGTVIWTVRFDLDGRTPRSTEFARLSDSQLKTLEVMRANVPLPELQGPEVAADISKH